MTAILETWTGPVAFILGLWLYNVIVEAMERSST